jgi:ferritin
MKILFSFLVTLVFLSGCGETPIPKEPKPEWINNHNIGAVGMCATHMRGNAAQEEVAHDRALKKLAKQKSASVKTSSVSSQHENTGRYTSSYDSETSVSSNVSNISAKEEKTWRNPRNNDYYIWLVPN